MVTLETVIQSHLSDALVEMHFDTNQAMKRINFVKFLANRYSNLGLKFPKSKLVELWNECHGIQN